MISKWIQIEFADNSIRAIDEIGNIRKAVESASLNLNLRHNVILQYPMPTENDKVVLEIKIPEDKEDFAIGNHLRGISTYLLKNCNGRYNGNLVGKRLLTYIEIPDANHARKDTIPMPDRLESIAKFARLLQRSDAEAVDLICRINDILD